jgi:amino acid transporter
MYLLLTGSHTGPDFIAMTAGEAQNPRKNMPLAFRGVFSRLTLFFTIGSLCAGLVVPYNDPDLIQALADPHAGASASPYVIAMRRMHIPVLPHIVNALVLTSVFSAGNSYVYCASRTLYGLALERRAPAIFVKCTRNGVPVYAVGLTVVVALICDFLLNSIPE